jgi:hypothetical protein
VDVILDRIRHLDATGRSWPPDHDLPVRARAVSEELTDIETHAHALEVGATDLDLPAPGSS